MRLTYLRTYLLRFGVLLLVLESCGNRSAEESNSAKQNPTQLTKSEEGKKATTDQAVQERKQSSTGGDSSGGGELLEDRQNPWFIQNTKVVTYCTLFDFTSFHQTAELTQEMVRQAFEFWKDEFKLGSAKPFEPRIDVATQDFMRKPCTNGNKDVDIVFQFGFLFAHQMEQIKNPSRYAGLTIRTEYDQENLKGKGFIYIAADTGETKFKGDKTIDMPWTFGDGGLLYWTLVHELGHVFGLQHNNMRGDFLNVMANNFMEVMMTGWSQNYSRKQKVRQVFRITERKDDSWQNDPNCETDSYHFPLIKKFFGINPEWKCYAANVRENGLAIYAGINRNSLHLMGIAEINEIDGSKQSFNSGMEALHFSIGPNQKVFATPISHIFTPFFWIEDIVATFKSFDGSLTRQLSYTLNPTSDSGKKIGGWMDGHLYINLLEGI